MFMFFYELKAEMMKNPQANKELQTVCFLAAKEKERDMDEATCNGFAAGGHSTAKQYQER